MCLPAITLNRKQYLSIVLIQNENNNFSLNSWCPNIHKNPFWLNTPEKLFDKRLKIIKCNWLYKMILFVNTNFFFAHQHIWRFEIMQTKILIRVLTRAWSLQAENAATALGPECWKWHVGSTADSVASWPWSDQTRNSGETRRRFGTNCSSKFLKI